MLDITQTLLQEYFTMVMLVDVTDCTCSFESAPASARPDVGAEMKLSIRIQKRRNFQRDASHLRGRRFMLNQR
ncbi:MAG: hypothetical protein ACOX0U_07970 [Oscillospiraceae bacterium]